MEEELRPTGITHEEVIEAAEHGGTVPFEGREAQVIGFKTTPSSDAPNANAARLTLDLGEEGHVVIVGHFWNGELIEEHREDPFSGPP